MKLCTSKEQDTCRVEKMGCKGCYYNDDRTEINNALKILKEIDMDDLGDCWDYGDDEYKAIQTVIDYVERTEYTRTLAIGFRRMYKKRTDKVIEFVKEQICNKCLPNTDVQYGDTGEIKELLKMLKECTEDVEV